MQVEMAYARNRGSAFTSWNKADFLASALDVEVTNGVIVSRAANRILVEISNSRSFKLTVRGFDEFRDLKVRTNEPMGE
jgi:hypothetical protein